MKENENRQYTYDAFISYRHSEPDKFIAENLHKQLEAFKPPKSIIKAGKASRTKIERVFRDKDELPLTSNLEDPLVKALIQSEYLIVICSPRLKESVWCQKEIETFISYHGRENIFAVLVEGEPEESFPEALLYEDEYFYYPDGTQGVNRKALEPLAADVRSQDGKKGMLKALRSEILRLLAPMFGVSYDDLRQRHRERKLKKIATVSFIAAILCLAIGAFSTAAALHIKKQKEQIETQADEIEAQADEIQAQNQKLLEQQAKNLAEKSLTFLEAGDRESAIITARQALSEYDGIKMPYTAEAKYALTESMHVYDSGNVMKARYQLTASGTIDCLLVSPDGKTAVTHDNMGALMVWDIETQTLLDTLTDTDTYFTERHMAFLDTDRFAYRTTENTIKVYSISEKKAVGTIEEGSALAIFSNEKGEYLVVKNWYDYTIYDANTLKQMYKCSVANGHAISEKCYFSDKNIMMYGETAGEPDISATAGDAEELPAVSGSAVLHFVNMKNGKEYASLPVPYEDILDVGFKGKIAYILTGKRSVQALERAVHLTAYNVSKGEVLWESDLDGSFADSLCISYAEDAKEFVLYSATEILLINEKTGARTGNFPLNADIVKVQSYDNTPLFMFFISSGRQGVLMPEQKNYIWRDYIFECKAQHVAVYESYASGALVLPYGDSRVTVYNASKGLDLQPCEDDFPAESAEKESQDYYIAEAGKLGLERAVLVTHILYSDDKSVAFVSYSDMTMEVYNVSDMSLLSSISDIGCEMTKYLGTDQEGSIYVAGETAGYCLDGSYRATAKIENLIAVDKENNRLIVGTSDAVYQLPIYTTDELLQMDIKSIF
ncbi:MAG: toll/interleukin-1 receptor domain-containing protein [Clostridium sp.]|nr:toll/interleukin-1 receptor domain-containing protein [Clostridium sp.]MCM1397850.1 toll/interleukin-1 receptor domain-containing protein [Clostridium sp.]MCM1459090.1 toll/interleukin-1 receptor domain-containing protein [Bacteroides sp.]